MMMEHAYLTTLGLAPGAGTAAIKKAYRALALRWHPDRCTSPADLDESSEMFRLINEAYHGALAAAAAKESTPLPDGDAAAQRAARETTPAARWDLLDLVMTWRVRIRPLKH